MVWHQGQRSCHDMRRLLLTPALPRAAGAAEKPEERGPVARRRAHGAARGKRQGRRRAHGKGPHPPLSSVRSARTTISLTSESGRRGSQAEMHAGLLCICFCQLRVVVWCWDGLSGVAGTPTPSSRGCSEAVSLRLIRRCRTAPPAGGCTRRRSRWRRGRSGARARSTRSSAATTTPTSSPPSRSSSGTTARSCPAAVSLSSCAAGLTPAQ